MKKAKIISVLAGCISACQLMNAQSSNSGPSGQALITCQLQYVEHEWQFNHVTEGLHQCQAIELINLPDEDEDQTEIVLDFKAKGRYHLLPDGQLVFASGYHYLVEDMLTGMIYDLRSLQPIAFSFNRASSEPRFVLTIKKSMAAQKNQPNSPTLTASK